MKRLFLLLLCALFFCGCSGAGIRDQSLNLEITPLPLERGKPALAKLNAPTSALEVIGRVKVMGSPEVVFRKDEKKGLWYFYGTIPFSPWVKPGSYTLRVTVTYPEGKPHYTEKKVELK